ncbi:hypothetical protein MKX01_016371 [Papaver californicum]|nr:hypothetical protein MKX01_016371 [Papaver californicum]
MGYISIYGEINSFMPTGSVGTDQVSLEKIRSASVFSGYPPSIYAALITTPEPDPSEQAVVYQGQYGGVISANTYAETGSRPARTWQIRAVEDCNVYVGTLDTFIEERESTTETVPYLGGKIDGKDKIPHKETRTKIPHSENIEKCSGCEGRGELPCRTCNAGQAPGHYKENQMTECKKCNGKGKLPCVTCRSRGLMKCETCEGQGSHLTRNVATVRWKTLKVSATSGAASVPDVVFHRAKGIQLSKGIQLCSIQAYQCTPAFFADSYFLNKFSLDVIAERAHVPPATRIICDERHIISVFPVTRVTMAKGNQSFSFYIIGVSREVYLKDYYPLKFCWGLCPCFEWLKL